MSDERKKSPGNRGPGGRGPSGGPKGGKPSYGKPARKKGDRPAAYRTERPSRPAGAAAEKREPRPRRDDAAASADAPKRSFKPRGEGYGEKPAHGEGRPFRKSTPGERPFATKGGDRPHRKPAEGSEKREFRPRRDAAAGEAEGPMRSYRPRSDGDRPGRRERAEGTDAPKRSLRPREEGAERARRPRNDAERPFRAREDEDRPFRRRFDGDAPRSGPRASATRRPERDVAAPEEGERIAKRLARAGISSRRDAEEMIAAGRVKVNGKVLASPAINVGPDDVIHVDNELIPAIERTRLFLFHKPGGVVTTNRDPEGRKTVFDVLPQGLPRLMTIGRLDINTEGLLLLTNDGGLARVLELPATGWLRRYRARVHGRVDEKALASLKDGIAVDGVFYGSIEASLDREQGTNAWLTIGLREGKNREVKNVLGALGLDVSRLIRVSFGPFQLGELAEGAVQELKGKALRDQLGDRLIAEAGANFEAPIVTEFSNKPVVRSRDAEPEAAPARRERRVEPGEGGLIKNRKRAREDHREDVLGRLGTKPDRGRLEGKGTAGGKPRGRTEKPFEPPKSRSANVWMAPGARPQGKQGKGSEDVPPSRRPEGPRDGSQGRKRPAVADASFRPRGPRKPRKDD